MIGKWAAWVVVAGAMAAAATPPAQAQNISSLDLRTVEDIAEASQLGQAARAKQLSIMAEAQRVCDRERYEAAKASLNRQIEAHINTVDARLRAISNSTGEQRVRDQRLGVELLFERERLTKLRAIYSREAFVPCEKEETVAEYVRICDTFGTGYFYIPGTTTCLKLDDESVERREIGDGGNRSSRNICDALGLSGLTISSDDECLRIDGSVRYEFRWGGKPTTGDASEGLSGGADFWDFSASFQPSLTFGGKSTRGAFSTETPGGDLVVPGYNFDTSFQGSSIGATFSARGNLSTLPLSVSAGFEVNSATASSSATDVAFPVVFGIPGVGPVSGAFIPASTDMLEFDFAANRQTISAYLNLGFTLYQSEAEMLEDTVVGYRVGGLVGLRGGSFSQHEMTTAVTSTPAFPTPGATSTYETDFTGGFSGLYAGLSLDKNIPFGDGGLSIQEMFSFAVGYDLYRLDVHDSVLMEGLGFASPILDDVNSFSVTDGVPTAELKGSVGVGTASWMVGINAGLSVGKTALIDYQRLDDGGNPHTNLLGEVGWSIGAGFTGRF